GCGTRTPRRLPGTTSPATDLARSRARTGPNHPHPPPDPHPSPPPPPPTPTGSPPRPPPPTSTPACSFAWKEACHGSRQHLADRHGRRHLGRVLHGLPAGPVPRRQTHRPPGSPRPPPR